MGRAHPDRARLDYAYETFYRIALEDGYWKIISLWDDLARTEALGTLEPLRQFRSQHG
jgi:hypothetical protein